MKKIFLFFLFLPYLVFATDTEPLDVEICSGYRQDNLNWKTMTNDALSYVTYQEKYKNLKYWQNDLTLKTVITDVYASANFGYGAFGFGTLSQVFSNLDFTTDPLFFYYNATASDFHAVGLIGYQINLAEGRLNKFYLTPLGGYAGFFKTAKRKNLSGTTSGDDFNFEPSLPYDATKEVWYGPLLGADVYVRPLGKVAFELRYLFCFASLDHRSKVSYIDSQYADGILTYQEAVTRQVSCSPDKSYGHHGIAKVFFIPGKHLKVGLGGDIKYFSTRNNVYVMTKIQTEEIFPTPGFTESKVKEYFVSRWWNVSVLFDLVYCF